MKIKSFFFFLLVPALMDTIQIVQTLRNCLPPPHIQVSSWKSESEGSTNLQGGNPGVVGSVVGMGNPSNGPPMMGVGNGANLLGNMSANRIENMSN